MRNPWRMQDGPDNKINRNNFPMSFQYNGTFKYGKIYPIGLIRTIPGASYQIDSSLALNFMPTSFPIQTRQRAYVHFFYGRDRNFWKDYKDFVNGMNPELIKPYIDEGITKARTGNLLDYLGIPTTIVGKYGNISNTELLNSSDEKILAIKNFFSDYSNPLETDVPSSISLNLDKFNNLVGTEFIPQRSASLETNDLVCIPFTFDNDILREIQVHSIAESYAIDFSAIPSDTATGSPYFGPLRQEQNIYGNFCKFIIVNTDNKVIAVISPKSISTDLLFELNGNISKCYFVFPQGKVSVYGKYGTGIQSYNIVSNLLTSSKSIQFIINEFQNGVVDINENSSPYWRSNDSRGKSTIKLSAIPPRMYETIYNLYYRNPQNNPYILNGKPEYNIFIPTKDGGADSNLYELRYRNWEDDFLTTAVQTPQQGIAPLVGLTDRGATVTLTNEDGSVTRYKTNLDENGNITGIETTDSSEPLLTQALIDAVSYGISIEDLRNVNAMQKWLELNLRKGYQYKDIIEARWGISISYNELDLPEFIGGFTQEVGLQAVTQTTSHGEGIEGALGWQAGRMYAAGSGRSITHYCEEEGYIMALLTVVPVPNYSQLLPKHWFTRDLLESYQPEFNHIGFQPITYKEVCPIQAFQESTENVDVLEQTFGYQRPWYEYFNQVDEVHGQFRTTFKDFLINRTFDVKPELSESFLLVDPNQVNDVFTVQTDDDKIIGAIEHRITAKLPISLYAQARLE